MEALKKGKTFLGNNRDWGGDWEEGYLQSAFNKICKFMTKPRL